jgi:predicted nucleic acid-binding protein
VTVLVDTNVLLRQFEPSHPHFLAAVDSTARLTLSGEPVHVTAQNVAEFWATATRSPAQNGLGLSVEVAAAALDHIEQMFVLLPDHPAIYDHWRRLITMHRVLGNKVYDARLVAAMTVHGIGRLLTFNAGDFARYGIEVIEPSAVL